MDYIPIIRLFTWLPGGGLCPKVVGWDVKCDVKASYHHVLLKTKCGKLVLYRGSLCFLMNEVDLSLSMRSILRMAAGENYAYEVSVYWLVQFGLLPVTTHKHVAFGLYVISDKSFNDIQLRFDSSNQLCLNS